MAEAVMTESKMDELVTEVGDYLLRAQTVELNRKAWFAMGACLTGGFYAGVRAHIWWLNQKQNVKNLTEPSE